MKHFLFILLLALPCLADSDTVREAYEGKGPLGLKGKFSPSLSLGLAQTIVSTDINSNRLQFTGGGDVSFFFSDQWGVTTGIEYVNRSVRPVVKGAFEGTGYLDFPLGVTMVRSECYCNDDKKRFLCGQLRVGGFVGIPLKSNLGTTNAKKTFGGYVEGGMNHGIWNGGVIGLNAFFKFGTSFLEGIDSSYEEIGIKARLALL